MKTYEVALYYKVKSYRPDGVSVLGRTLEGREVVEAKDSWSAVKEAFSLIQETYEFELEFVSGLWVKEVKFGNMMPTK